MKFRIILTSVIVSVFFSTLLIVGSAFAKESKTNDVDTYRLLNLFGDVFERIRSDYVEAPTNQKMIEAAISGMLSSLDPHSSYMNAKSFRDMQVNTRGEFGGLGIQVTMERGYVKVISPIDDTPASRAGIKPSDFISHLDGTTIRGLTLNQAVDKMRGKVGSEIKLTIRREGKDPFDVTLTRAIIKIKSVRSRVEEKIGYIRITQFNEQTDKGLKEEIFKLRKEIGSDIQGYILDLRNNPGGLLDQAIAVSDAFLEKGEIVSTRSRRLEDTQRFNARPGDLTDGLPIILLVNGGSASASEIVAGALQDHRRAIILGTRSFGKGSVQTIVPLSGHGAMRLTTARYFTPSGRSIQAKGIDPDILVEQARIETLDSPKRRSESDLRNALDNGNDTEKNKKDKSEAAKTGAKEKGRENEPPQDYQLARSLDLLRGIAMFSNKAEKIN